MSRHTPGPWAADDNEVKAKDGTWRAIAVVEGENVAADTCLMAAAPELLDLVALAVAGTEADDEVWLGHAWVKAARKAIKKAGGEP